MAAGRRDTGWMDHRAARADPEQERGSAFRGVRLVRRSSVSTRHAVTLGNRTSSAERRYRTDGRQRARNTGADDSGDENSGQGRGTGGATGRGTPITRQPSVDQSPAGARPVSGPPRRRRGRRAAPVSRGGRLSVVPVSLRGETPRRRDRRPDGGAVRSGRLLQRVERPARGAGAGRGEPDRTGRSDHGGSLRIGIPGLDEPSRFVLGTAAVVTTPGAEDPASGRVTAALFSGTDAASHVDLVRGRNEGALFPDLVADTLGVDPGDTVELHDDDSDRSVTIRVGGVYRSLYTEPRSGYWSPWSEKIYPQCFDCPAPPQFILLDRETLSRLNVHLGERLGDYGWVLPVREGPLTIDEAREIGAGSSEVFREAQRFGTRIGRVLRCCGTTFGGFRFFGRRDIEFRSSMPLVLHKMDRRAATAEGPLRLLLSPASAWRLPSWPRPRRSPSRAAGRRRLSSTRVDGGPSGSRRSRRWKRSCRPCSACRSGWVWRGG